MNYRHAFHAGNFADCLKHAALVAVLLHLRKKETPFAVIDTHGGCGLYDIAGEQAKKTGEAKDGIERLLPLDSVPGVLEPYCEMVRSFGEGIYPGSPLIAAKLLRAKDRLVAIEKHPEEQAALARALRPCKRARVVLGDYVRELPKLLPPPERRGIVLIDPPYEAADEFAVATRAAIAAWQRFSTGIVLFWYPAKERPLVAASAGELLNAGIKSLLKLELDLGIAAGTGGRERLSAAGLLVVNPPFGFAEEMRRIMPFLEQNLARGPSAHGTVEIFAEP
ncbi:MAG TPA: 23S rRNA (adenine(2030)-N(6))-methyltransferase RlmJ [Micropepsaceae bacterium]|jgi:23S rRNA (adenine2030-N6)-methyltransferase|nr:23S rRNA (adenine(2030)-N(6))-methyltransferase RlmJ [Micropepsaceae bacterium]